MLSIVFFFSTMTAPPRAPFPTIMECRNQTVNGQNCNITTSHDLNITCTVHDYYPEITLYFRHKSKHVETQSSSVWNNTDWTINKNVTIVAVPSDDPYICVASDIPGLGDHEEIAMIYVNTPPPESTTEYPVTRISTESNSHHTNYLVSEYKETVFLMISYHIAEIFSNINLCILILYIHYDHACKLSMTIKQ